MTSQRVLLRRQPPGERRDAGLGPGRLQKPLAEPEYVQSGSRCARYACQQKTLLLQRSVDLGHGRTIVDRTRRGFDVRDQVWPLILTRFREIHFIADPRRAVLAGIVSVDVVGGVDNRAAGGMLSASRHWGWMPSHQ